MGWPFLGLQPEIGIVGGTRHSVSRHTFGVMTWVGLTDVATHFWCCDMMLAALWPLVVATEVGFLGVSRPARSRQRSYARSRGHDNAQCARDWVLGVRTVHTT